MARDGLEILRPFDAIFFGAVGFPTVPDHVSLRGLRLPICQGFEQYVCYRPSVLLPGVKSPLAGKRPGDVDFVVIRENTEGEYAGAGGRSHVGLPIEVAVQTAVFTRVGIERVVRYAFQLARRRRKKLVSATKSNAQQHTLTLWDEVAEAVGREFPDVALERVLIDALAARFVLAPESLDVVVASNLFGDILTDLGAAICGSMGLAAERQHQPGTGVPVHVRAGARLGAGHRGQGHRQPRGAGRERRDDARVPRGEGGGRPRHGGGPGGAGRGSSADAGPGRHGEDGGSDRGRSREDAGGREVSLREKR